MKEQHNILPKFYYRYVDDTIICIHKEDLQKVVEIFNNYDPNLKFTYEVESDNMINFLDISLIKHNNYIATNWYPKPTNSNRLLNFDSYHTLQQNRNIVYNLIDRSILLAHSSFHIENLAKVKEMLLRKDYPLPFITSCIGNRLRKIQMQNQNINKRIDNNNLESMNLGTMSLPFKSRFYSQCSKLLSRFNIRTMPLLNNKLIV